MSPPFLEIEYNKKNVLEAIIYVQFCTWDIPIFVHTNIPLFVHSYCIINNYFIDFFYWYIKHSTIEGYNHSNKDKMDDHHLVVMPDEYCCFRSIIRESDIRTEYLPSDAFLHFVDLIITKYLKLILEKSDLNNLDKFGNFFLSLSYR